LVLYLNKGTTRITAFVSEKYVTRNQHLVNAWKVLVPKARGVTKTGPDVVIGTPILAEPGSVCTLTYLAIGPFETQQMAQNFIDYLQTRVARFLISLRKPTQDTTQSSYEWLPLLDFSEAWTEDKLALYFHLTESDTAFINERVKELNT
jgi:site-specific DNA-methyltransferase (adenine-specific)